MAGRRSFWLFPGISLFKVILYYSEHKTKRENMVHIYTAGISRDKGGGMSKEIYFQIQKKTL